MFTVVTSIVTRRKVYSIFLVFYFGKYLIILVLLNYVLNFKTLVFWVAKSCCSEEYAASLLRAEMHGLRNSHWYRNPIRKIFMGPGKRGTEGR